MLGSSDSILTSDTSSGEPTSLFTRLEEGYRRKSLPPLETAAKRTILKGHHSAGVGEAITQGKSPLKFHRGGGSRGGGGKGGEAWMDGDPQLVSAEFGRSCGPGTTVSDGYRENENIVIVPTNELPLTLDRKNSLEAISGLDSEIGGPKATDGNYGEGSRVASGKINEIALGSAEQGDSGEDADEENSPQRLFIGWVQARHREIVTVISLGCVTALFIKHVSQDYSGTLPMIVTFIPVVVHLLLVRDIYVKWGERKRRKQEGLAASKNEGDRMGDVLEQLHVSPVSQSSPGDGGVRIDGVDGIDRLDRSQWHQTESSLTTLSPPNGMSFTTESQNSSSCSKPENAVSESELSNFEFTSSSMLPPGVIADTSAIDGQSSAERAECWSETTRDSPPTNDAILTLLETPFQKSVRLLKSACDKINDPIVRKVLQKVAKLLSDPESLHSVKEGAMRRASMDSGTRNYIENVLQTPVKSNSAEDNWKKLRTGMYVVRAMAREAVTADNFLSAFEPRKEVNRVEENATAASDASSDHNNTDLDDLLEDIANGVDTTSHDVNSPVQSSTKKSTAGDNADQFSNCNRCLIQGQQLVAKTLSRGEFRKDPDRLSVGELRDLASEPRTPGKILENRCADEGESNDDGEFVAGNRCPLNPEIDENEMLVPRLPSLDESLMGSIASLLAGGEFLKWDFNVFTLEERSQGHSLWFAAMSAFSHYNLIGAFGLSVDRLSRLFLRVEATYCFSPDTPNMYHTHVHAADVTLTVAHFLSAEAIANTVRSTHGLALLMAAIMHDYRHPGVNNGYLVRQLDPLAVTYNDASVLENFHASEGFKLMIDPSFDVFKGWKPDDVKSFRFAFVKCILATDLALSMEYCSKFQSLSASMASQVLQGGTEKGGIKPVSAAESGKSLQSQILVLQMVLKVADVAHPCKPWEVHTRWTELVTEEFFKQGDKEAARALTVSPLCDRRDRNLPKSQCDFISFIVRPCVTIFSSYCEVTTWNDHLERNLSRWRTLYEEQGGSSRLPSSPGSRRRSFR